jgi:hypothetical protein
MEKKTVANQGTSDKGGANVKKVSKKKLLVWRTHLAEAENIYEF